MKAFPSPHDPKTGTMQLGMELRDYFAAKAMQGIMASSEIDWENSTDLASTCYKIADEMLRAREE
jgi:hypothetical protein